MWNSFWFYKRMGSEELSKDIVIVEMSHAEVR